MFRPLRRCQPALSLLAWRGSVGALLLVGVGCTNPQPAPSAVDRIPVIGAAFGTTDHNVQRTKLLVPLSPKIVHNAADARAATEELRSRLHSLQGSDTRLP